MIPELSECRPGVKPTRYNLLIAIERVEEKTAGGILLPTKHVDREESGAVRGRVVDISPMAFKGGDWTEDAAPKVGDVVIFQRYAGGATAEIEGDDGHKYRIVADEEIRAIAL